MEEYYETSSMMTLLRYLMPCSHYKKYTDLFDIDEVPEVERNQVAQDVATWVLANLRAKGLRFPWRVLESS